MMLNRKAIALLVLALPAGVVHAALQQDSDDADILIGKNNDNVDNPVIQLVKQNRINVEARLWQAPLGGSTTPSDVVLANASRL